MRRKSDMAQKYGLFSNQKIMKSYRLWLPFPFVLVKKFTQESNETI